jgi:hypothetical protein
MWWRYPNEEESFDELIKKPKERFQNCFLSNFKFLLQEDMLLQHFPSIWDVSNQHSSESEYMYDLCITVPSILIELFRYEEAVQLLVMFKSFYNDKLNGTLNLMHASILVYIGSTN